MKTGLPKFDKRRTLVTFDEECLRLVLGRTIEVICGRDIDKVLQMPIDQLLIECKVHILSIPISWYADDLITTEKYISYLVPLLERFKDGLSKEKNTERIQKRIKEEIRMQRHYLSYKRQSKENEKLK